MNANPTFSKSPKEGRATEHIADMKETLQWQLKIRYNPFARQYIRELIAKIRKAEAERMCIACGQNEAYRDFDYGGIDVTDPANMPYLLCPTCMQDALTFLYVRDPDE